jgi:transposase
MSEVRFRVRSSGGEGGNMPVVYRRCGGLDVHKDSITATVLVFGEEGQREVRKKEFGTHWKELQRLGKWLRACRVERVAMESTGVYWKPVWNVLEKSLGLVLANPYQVKNIPSQKTDRRDSEWIADLLAHDLIRPSFVPAPEIRHVRELTRYRVQLAGERNRVHNRIHKVLEDANLKLDTVLSDLLGVSGRAMLRAIVNGHCDPGWLADYARGSLRGKREQLELVLRGDIRDHHRYLLGELLADLEFIESKILRLDQELLGRMQPYQDAVNRLCTIPGVDILTAWTLLAELGPDVTVFPDAAHAASWAGLCPGNHESAGKRLSSRTRKGNRWLRRALCQSAWAVTRKKNCYLAAHFYRRAAQHGVKKAIVATAHQLLIIAYHLLRDRTVYRELGGNFYDRLHPERTQNRLIRRLERLGLQVVVRPQTQTAEPPVPKHARGRPCKCFERGIPCKHRH